MENKEILQQGDTAAAEGSSAVKIIIKILLGVISTVFMAAALALCVWLGVNAHIPTAATAASGEKGGMVTDLGSKFQSNVINAKSDALGGLTYIRKQYSIEEGALVAPKPDEKCFGSTTDPEVIKELVKKAEMLLEGDDTIWKEDIVLLDGMQYNYYLDDTILVINWKEEINGKACCCTEIKIADASQLRRKITGDVYDSGIRAYGSEMSAQVNAVFSTNADFYAFRPSGITVYDRTLYRCDVYTLDSCFFDSKGEMHMTRARTFSGREDVEAYIRDNDIRFGISFGPILIEDGVKNPIYGYPIGEIDDRYSRSVIGMTNERHYFAMTINHDVIMNHASIYELQDIVCTKGLRHAYTLDGGQTAEQWMHGNIINHIDFGSERLVSDIIYFATAIPEGTGVGA